MKKTKRMIRNLIIFILLIILTFYIILKDQNITEIFSVFQNVKKQYILIAALCMCIYIVCEAINIGRTLKNLNEKSTFWQNIKYALVGFFFSSITPAASGGQPMQIYYMYKDKISVANSTLALLINLSSMQVVTISIALISVIFNHKYLNGPLIGFFILPIIFNVIGLILGIITFASNPKEEKEGTKPIWKYKNKARGIGMSGLLLNIVGIVFMIFNMIFGIVTFNNIF